ncbi:MAG: erythromycin esterase family protein, partial [Hymenobacteraceae bacterium]|nr:erythromycin esterase family protein [Hymenobacteraceae bacterium]
LRDVQMAKNLQWLAYTKYPEEKIIVWAANGHIMKNADTAIKGKKTAAIGWMGTTFAKDSLNASQTYVLGFSSLQGTYKRTTEKEEKAVPRPLKQGFETWIDKRVAYGFVDFKPFRLLYPQYDKMFMMKPRQFNMTGNWTSVFDGIFYIRDMMPCETLGAKEKL